MIHRKTSGTLEIASSACLRQYEMASTANHAVDSDCHGLGSHLLNTKNDPTGVSATPRSWSDNVCEIAMSSLQNFKTELHCWLPPSEQRSPGKATD